MTRTLRYLLLLVIVGCSGSAFAQEILGRVKDDKNEPIMNASIAVRQGGILKGGAISDFDGNYSVKPLDPGVYEVEVSYAGLENQKISDVQVVTGGQNELNVIMKKTGVSKVLNNTTVKAQKKKLIDPYNHITSYTKEEIQRVPGGNDLKTVASLSPGIYQSRRGADLSSDGSRTSGNLYVIDGVQVQGSTGIGMASGSTEGVDVISSGISAKYGDVSGAVISFTSRGPAPKLTGDIHAEHSIDGYNNNNVSFSIAGPVLKKRTSLKDSVKKTVMGFSLSGEYYYDADRYPSYLPSYTTKSNILADLQKNPLKIVSDNSGQNVYNNASDYITNSDLTTVKRPPHNVTREGRLNGKIDYQMNDNVRIVAGGTLDYTKQDQYSSARNLFAPEATPISNTLTARGYVRFTQKFGKQGVANKANDSGKANIISNAFYSVQIDYQKLNTLSEDPRFGKNIFQYAYIGKFNKTPFDLYLPSTDSASDRVGNVLILRGTQGINFQRSELNTNLANYTTQYYNSLNGFTPNSIQAIQSKNGLANGDEPNYTYGMFLSPGATQSYYSTYNSNQYALTVDASFDLKTGNVKHAIEFGLYYQQRVEKSFTVSANYNGSGTASLWQLMRQYVSSIDNGNLKLDKNNPIFRVNGHNYTLADVKAGVVLPSPTDTITYNNINYAPTTFDNNLRARMNALGMKVGKNDDINIDALDPSVFSLNLFSADELLNSGNPFVNYYGYSYTGDAQTGTVNFNDFWTKKDANGNYTRPIGAFSPNYVAGYVLDKFKYKDILFNIGVRVDRYSANTKVLKDPYSEYEEKTVGSVNGVTNYVNGGKHPSNMGSGYVVYVDDNSSTSPAIIGYRNGTNWYDPTGKAIEDPSVLKNYSGGRDPQPYLVNSNVKITDTNFNPNSSFTDYNPQVTVMPRIQIGFPITEAANFFAHYDIYEQRPYPTGLGIATAYDYYYLNQNSNQIISNANLRSQKTFDYELGFEQLIGKKSALKITGFYKERKDMIAVVPYLYAWPTTYYTYGNRDFSSTKGVKLFYDLRATNHLSMTISYTLQFAEGTGSTPYSSNGGSGGSVSPNGLLQNFIEAGLPNLRYISSLDVDSRHNIVTNIDYRFKDGEGPTIGGNHVFQNSGIDLIARARSGEPYTRFSNAQGNTVIGGINGSRLPWHFGVDLRINKDFAISFGGSKTKEVKPGVKVAKVYKISTFIYVQNLLNTREILGVYGYTGKPDDNGYLSSSYGHQFVPQQVSPQSYTDLYKIANNGAGNFNLARTINFGVEYNF